MTGLPVETLAQLDVSRETIARLEVFASVLQKWNPRINLVSRNSLGDLWTRHIVDSIHVFRFAPVATHWTDLGSGGGFPGLIVAILAADENPTTHVTLIESDQRKAVFLRTAARETGVKCSIISQRIESVEAQNADVLSARALAELSALLGFAERHLKPNGTALFPKGATWQKELDAARRQWHFDLEVIKSPTKPDAAILKIKGISRV